MSVLSEQKFQLTTLVDSDSCIKVGKFSPQKLRLCIISKFLSSDITYSSLRTSQCQSSLGQPVCQRKTAFKNDQPALQRQKTANGKKSKRRRKDPIQHAKWYQLLPPEDLSLLPFHYAVCDSTATLLRGASWERDKSKKRIGVSVKCALKLEAFDLLAVGS